MTSSLDDTGGRTRSQVPAEPSAEPTGPALFVVLNADKLDTPASYHSLDGVDDVYLRRGATRAAVRVQEGRRRQLVLTFPDRWMSSAHAVLERRDGHFWVRDADSKNGTFAAGSKIEAARLGAATLLEVGHTFLLFRDSVARRRGGSPDFVSTVGCPPTGDLQTLSASVGKTFELLTDVATSSIPVLVNGESGTGKELASRALHRMSERRGPFVAVNCGAFSPALVEAELCVDVPHLFGPEASAGHPSVSGPVSSSPSPSSSAAPHGAARVSELPPLEPEDLARRDELVALLREHRGNVTAVARTMGKARVQVQRWIRRYQLNRREPA